MKYFVGCVCLLLVVSLCHAQNEDMPHCDVSKEIITKNGIKVFAQENRNYFLGIYRKAYSWKIVYKFDSSGNIISQNWVSLKNEKQDHITTYKYDAHGNLTNRKITSEGFNVEYEYFYTYNSQGLIEQYYTQSDRKILYKYDRDKLVTYKLDLTPIDTVQTWSYFYENKRLSEVRHKLRALPTSFVTRYRYENNKLILEIETTNSDTISATSYHYNSDGKETEEINAARGEISSKNREYNSLGQLAKFTKKTGKDKEVTIYSYDNDGFLVGKEERSDLIFGVVDRSKFYYQQTEKINK
jgi:hypothetical protein